ncbi:MAG: polysaccharide deacetylase family protein [Clostridia bacterium]|nr:polysaccharide deacetylase family protein [Clostridia bacterium]
MWNGKNKAVTFSFDDGVTQDARCVEILNKYGLKATFNLNSQLLGKEGKLCNGKRTVRHDKIEPNEVAKIYVGHEVAVHTLTHPLLPTLTDDEIAYQVEEDRKNLSKLCGYEVVGMAYPGGGKNCDARVANVVRTRTGVQYARTNRSVYCYDLPKDLYFVDGVYYIDERLDAVVDEFLALKTDKPQMLYIWGHSYEMDFEFITWEKFEEICKKLSGKTDIFYGTNAEVLLKK